ncbi:hypothetical protein F7734_46655 [Scytonema sp. UIC 10036]|uniref:hypothetical protein n=1 Tax=Scytonema sp. UIC 10036 TaxID=2304196 RepID=UPI0012DA9217|nr:hypothetical protein [Scytonema sp. UIC 10036]MUG99376.1 hypothetical protein [Scytonema sp. UIC 10036]
MNKVIKRGTTLKEKPEERFHHKKLTLLHHGALQTPRLPMPLYGSDRMAYLRLKGIYPSNMLEGDRQFWL